MATSMLSGSRLALRGPTPVQGRVQARRAARSPGAVVASASNKCAIVTGANTGIGLETVKGLAKENIATVLACRDLAKAEAACQKVREAVPGADVTAMRLDLASLSSVRDFSKEYLDSGRSLEVLINNAGVMATPLMRTEEGLELQIGVNHFGHFLLTDLLMDRIKEAERARIVNVSSSAHQFGKMNWSDLQSEQGYQPWVAYGQSKLANLLFTYELARKLPADGSITVNALHPGVVNTELFRYNMPDEQSWLLKPVTKLMEVAFSGFTKTPAQGAETSIYLATSPEVEGVSSKYWSDCKILTTTPLSYNQADAKRLWEVSQEITAAKESTVIVM